MVNEIGLIFVFAGAIMLIFRLLKQPMIPAFVLAGVIIGPLFLGLIRHPEEIKDLSEVAIVVMLFIIGSEMDLDKLKLVGPVATIGGFLQVILTAAIGYAVGMVFGQPSITSCYIGLVAAFSSTMLAVKIMGEKHDLNTMYGRITIGILVMQDVLAIFALSILATINDFSLTLMISTVTAVAGLILLVVFIGGIYIFPKLFDFVSKDRELLFGTAMAILFIVGFYAVNQKLSLGIGAFLAGLAISRLAYRYEIIGDLKALKSFFSVLFFASLGLQLVPFQEGAESISYFDALGSSLRESWPLIASLALVLIVIKPILVMCIVAMFGYRRSTCFGVGSALGQASEFGLLLVASGISQGHLALALLSPIIIVTVLSMTISSYVMGFEAGIFRFFSGWIGWVEILRLPLFCHEETCIKNQEAADGHKVVLVGRDRLGKIIQLALRQLKVRYLVIDSNPSVIHELRVEGIPCIFGDVTSYEVLDQIDFGKVEVVFSAIPNSLDNEALIKHIQNANPKTNFIAIVDSIREAKSLYGIGAHYVLVPYVLAAMQLIHSRGSHGANLHSLVYEGENVRELGVKHREALADEIMAILAALQDTASNVDEAVVAVEQELEGVGAEASQ